MADAVAAHRKQQADPQGDDTVMAQPRPREDQDDPEAGAGPLSFGAEADLQPRDAAPRGHPPTVLRQRADFLRTASARRQAAPGFLLQARDRGDGGALRVGYTCSKKLGNAVTRNRAKRRLRAVARAVMPQMGRAGWDYVLVGRPDVTVSRDFAALCADLREALTRIHARPSRFRPRKEARR